MSMIDEIAGYIDRLVSENPFISGIILFGSISRREKRERSDIDLLILWDKLEMNIGEAYIYIYKIIRKYFPANIDLTVLEMNYLKFISMKEITPLILNILWDGIVLYDKHGKLRDFILNIRKKIEKSGLKRKKSGKYYYWILPKPGERVKLEV